MLRIWAISMLSIQKAEAKAARTKESPKDLEREAISKENKATEETKDTMAMEVTKASGVRGVKAATAEKRE